LGFNGAYLEIVAGVAAFSILMVAYNGWIRFVEKNSVYIGDHSKTGARVIISTIVNKTAPKYTVNVEVQHKGQSSKSSTVGEFTEWFDLNGYLVFSRFQAFLQSQIDKKKQ